MPSRDNIPTDPTVENIVYLYDELGWNITDIREHLDDITKDGVVDTLRYEGYEVNEKAKSISKSVAKALWEADIVDPDKSITEEGNIKNLNMPDETDIVNHENWMDKSQIEEPPEDATEVYIAIGQHERHRVFHIYKECGSFVRANNTKTITDFSDNRLDDRTMCGRCEWRLEQDDESYKED